MKIAFLTPEFPHAKTGTSGGIGTSIFNLSQGLTQLGHKVLILVYGQDCDAVFHENDVIIYKIKNIKVKGFSAYFTQKKIQKLINHLHKNNELDIVEAPDWTGFSAFIKPKCPLVIRLNGSDTYFCHLENRPVKWLNRYLENRALQNCDGIISVSRFTGELTQKLFKLTKDFTVIPNAIDAQLYDNFEANDAQTILYFGTLIRKKGLLELPLLFNEVHKKIPNAVLLLVGKDASDIFSGSTSTWQLMQSLFTASALQQVRYLGAVSYDAIKTQIASATVCVFPTFAEALPVSWLEAMAMQKAIVASNIGWAKELLEDGKNGFLEYPKNHLAFAEKIVRLLEDEELRKTFGKEARNTVLLNFTIKVVAQQSVAFYKNYLD